MSWISNNYEKAAIGGAAVVALAFAAIVVKNKGAIEEIAVLPTPKENNDTSVLGLLSIEGTRASLSDDHVITQYDLKGRKVNLLTGVALFAKKDDTEKLVDLLNSPAVHKGIENTWWLKYDMDTGVSDAPDQDPDEDGFTNREEYTAGTNPVDKKSYPELLEKLMAKGVRTTEVHVRAQNFGGEKFTFKLQTKRGATVNSMAAKPIVAGQDIVFVRQLMQNRFKFLKHEKINMVKGGIRQDVSEWTLVDKQPNKKGVEYKIDRRGNPGIFDSTIKLELNALKEKGKPFEVAENTTFALPFDEKAKVKPYLLKMVDLVKKNVEIEYTDKDGNKKSKFFTF